MRAATWIARSLIATSVALGAACGEHGPREAEPTSTAPQAFDSNEGLLLDFDIDGKLVTDTTDPAAIRPLVQSQLLYSVGVLNADGALGRLERVEVSQIASTPREGGRSFLVTYRAKLPVAWSRVPLPTALALTLPARAGEDDQKRFAAKYGKTCVDADAGELTAADAGKMFYEYRPMRAGCVLDPSDVVTLQASIAISPENTHGRYPEYQRVWEDGALDVVVLFSRSAFEAGTDDEGIRAFGDFVAGVDARLRERQPDPTKVIADAPSPSTASRSATLPDGRVIRIDAALVGTRLADEGPELDAWYDARTPSADLILYSGHAGLGANVRALMTKGAFVPRKYLVWVLNGCDTFAYVDRTLADRRAALNPDDPGATRYMDTVSTAMGGFFSTGAATTLTFVDAFVGARDPGAVPKTYRAMFAGIDPRQVTVVTGEEDNAFDPAMFAQPGAPPSSDAPPVESDPAPAAGSPPPSTVSDGTTTGNSGASCSTAPGATAGGAARMLVIVLAAAGAARRSRTPRIRAA